VLNDISPQLSFDDAKKNCKAIVATLESAATGKAVKI
jgi:hypothetical protein